MALTVNILCTLAATSPANTPRKIVVARITGDSSYALAGEALVAADLGLTTIESMVSMGGCGPTGGGDTGRLAGWDRTAGKMLFYQAGTADSALNDSDSADDLSGVTVDILAVGY